MLQLSYPEWPIVKVRQFFWNSQLVVNEQGVSDDSTGSN